MDVQAEGEVRAMEISAVVTRADGTVEDYGVVSGFTTDETGKRVASVKPEPLWRRALGLKRKDAVPVSVKRPGEAKHHDIFRVVVSHPSPDHPNHAPFSYLGMTHDVAETKDFLASAKADFPEYDVFVEGLVIAAPDGAASWERVE